MNLLDTDDQNGETETFRAEFIKTDFKEDERRKELNEVLKTSENKADPRPRGRTGWPQKQLERSILLQIVWSTENFGDMKKDINKPKGKTSAYAFFVKTCREEHKMKSPGSSVNFAEFSKECSERWKNLSPKEKGLFEDRARVDKARYDREMQSYIPPKGSKKRRMKDPNAPKRPPSAFFVFCSEHRASLKSENPGITIGEIAKKLGEMWAKLSPTDKAPFEQTSAKLREKYEKEIAAYRGKGDASHRGPPVQSVGTAVVEPMEEEEEEDDDEDDGDEDDD
ncbi:hypothetical protein GJAV_G00163920 [Gymnothorax javanicus]|nr:hypothetical protein GJAV_G00163920 [Gymnothorax javanicus]